MQKQKPKRYLTKRRRARRSILKTIVILLALSLGAAAIGIGQQNFLNYYDQIVLEVISDTGGLPVAPNKKSLRVEERILIAAKEIGFEWPGYLVRLARCESVNTCEDPETCTNDQGNYPPGSVDRGVFMINNYWHPEVSDECAFNLECATKWTMDRINNGYQHEWPICNEIAKRN